jgi:hypothetical protein
VPSDERRQVRPDPAKILEHDTGRGIILRIIRGGTPLQEPDQHPDDSLMRRLVGHRTSPHRHGVVHVRSHWRRLPSGPETGPPRRGSRVSRFLEWFHGQGDIVHCYPGNRERSERALRRDVLAKKARTSRACVRKFEAGVYDFTVGTLRGLATALGVQ